jgi:hypothetical protein
MQKSHGYAAADASRNPNRRILQSLLVAIGSMLVVVLSAPPSIFSQAGRQSGAEANFLPPTTGEPLTIKPLDMQDIDCTVAQWAPASKRSVLTLICPPNTVFSPIRVLIKLSWMKPDDAPVSPERILAPVGTLTKIRTKNTLAEIWLPVEKDRKDTPQQSWVGFNAVVDVALLRGRPK